MEYVRLKGNADHDRDIRFMEEEGRGQARLC
jgi:hypothetical protein